MDIEEDIKILEKFKNNEMQRDKLERDSRCGGWKIGDIYKKLELNIAIDHILAEREEDKKKIEELEDRCKSHQKLLYEAAEVEKNSIPKQKVKEIFDRLHISDIEPWSTYKVSGDILFDLKELLEDK